MRCSPRSTVIRPDREASAARMYLHGGLFFTHDATLGMLAGSTLGGGTTINSMVSLRTPDDMRAFVDRAHALGLGVLLDVGISHELDRILPFNGRRDLREIAPCLPRRDLDCSITRHVERIEFAERERLSVRADGGRSVQAHQPGLELIGVEPHRGVARVEHDAAVVQVAGRRGPRSD